METLEINNELLVAAVTKETGDDGRTFSRVKFLPVLKEMYTDDGRLIKRITGNPVVKIYNEAKAPEVDAVLGGKVMTFKTTPYTITSETGANTVNTTTVIVFTGEDAVTVANKQLARNRASVLDNQGNPTVKFEAVPPAGETKPNITDPAELKRLEEDAKKAAAAAGAGK